MRIALIDADSLVYVIAWKYREVGTEQEVQQACDNMLREILDITVATHYVGVFSPKKCFRHDVYRYAQYKGNRSKEKEEWLIKWEPVIKGWFKYTYDFTCLTGLEADDVVSGLSYLHDDCIVVSPDKDLDQVPGLHYKPKKELEGVEIPGRLYTVYHDAAYRFLWLQVIMGDSGDNVAGVPGLGEVKAKKILDEAMDTIMYPTLAKSAFSRYFGGFYGPIIFQETVDTIQLLNPQHMWWYKFLEDLRDIPINPIKAQESIFDTL